MIPGLEISIDRFLRGGVLKGGDPLSDVDFLGTEGGLAFNLLFLGGEEKRGLAWLTLPRFFTVLSSAERFLLEKFSFSLYLISLSDVVAIWGVRGGFLGSL